MDVELRTIFAGIKLRGRGEKKESWRPSSSLERRRKPRKGSRSAPPSAWMNQQAASASGAFRPLSRTTGAIPAGEYARAPETYGKSYPGHSCACRPHRSRIPFQGDRALTKAPPTRADHFRPDRKSSVEPAWHVRQAVYGCRSGSPVRASPAAPFTPAISAHRRRKTDRFDRTSPTADAQYVFVTRHWPVDQIIHPEWKGIGFNLPSAFRFVRPGASITRSFPSARGLGTEQALLLQVLKKHKQGLPCAFPDTESPSLRRCAFFLAPDQAHEFRITPVPRRPDSKSHGNKKKKKKKKKKAGAGGAPPPPSGTDGEGGGRGGGPIHQAAAHAAAPCQPLRWREEKKKKKKGILI